MNSVIVARMKQALLLLTTYTHVKTTKLKGLLIMNIYMKSFKASALLIKKECHSRNHVQIIKYLKEC